MLYLSSPIAGKQSSVEECCGLAGIETASVEIINIKTDTESLVGIDGKVGFKTLFTVTAIESFIIAQVGKGRKRVGKYDIFRAEYGKVVWIGKKELTGIPTVEKKNAKGGESLSCPSSYIVRSYLRCRLCSGKRV